MKAIPSSPPPPSGPPLYHLPSTFASPSPPQHKPIPGHHHYHRQRPQRNAIECPLPENVVDVPPAPRRSPNVEVGAVSRCEANSIALAKSRLDNGSNTWKYSSSLLTASPRILSKSSRLFAGTNYYRRKGNRERVSEGEGEGEKKLTGYANILKSGVTRLTEGSEEREEEAWGKCEERPRFVGFLVGLTASGVVEVVSRRQKSRGITISFSACQNYWRAKLPRVQ